MLEVSVNNHSYSGSEKGESPEHKDQSSNVLNLPQKKKLKQNKNILVDVVFMAVKTSCMVLQWWMCAILLYIYSIPEIIELKADFQASCELWAVMICRCLLEVTNTILRGGD